MEHELDAVIASLNEQPEPEVQDTPKADVETKAKVEDQPEGDQETDAEDSVPFPKKAVNALSRRDKIIAKERAEKAALKAELEQLRSASQATPKTSTEANDAPKEEDFDNYGDFLEAKLLHKLKTEQVAEQEKIKAQQVSEQRQAWVAEREQEMVVKAQEHGKSIPDFVNVLTENADLLDELPDYIAQAFYEADDAAMAVYNLAREGKLESLATMSPYKAAMVIAKAQEPSVSVKRVSNAPNPIKGIQGRGTVTKDISEMSGDELLKKLNLRY